MGANHPNTSGLVLALANVIYIPLNQNFVVVIILRC